MFAARVQAVSAARPACAPAQRSSSAPLRVGSAPARRCIKVRGLEDELNMLAKLEDTVGLDNLLSRDRK